MPIAVTCPCGLKLQAPDTAAGKGVKCPKCAAVVKVPAGAKVGMPAAPAKAAPPGLPLLAPGRQRDAPSAARPARPPADDNELDMLEEVNDCLPGPAERSSPARSLTMRRSASEQFDDREKVVWVGRLR